MKQQLHDSVIGAMLLFSECVPDGIDLLSEQDFTEDNHKIIFSKIKEMYEGGHAIDMMTVCARLAGSKVSIYDVTKMTDHVAGHGNFGYWCGLLIQARQKRDLHQHAKKVQSKAQDINSCVVELIDSAQQELADISTLKGSRQAMTMPELVKAHVERTELIASGSIEASAPTKLRALDKLQVFQPGDFIIWAGRPSMGKTASALQVAKNYAEQGYNVAFFSLEMSAMQLMNRLVANEGRIELGKVLNASFDGGEKQDYVNAMSKISTLPLFIDDQPDINTVQLKNKLRKLELKHGKIHYVFIDYIQLMSNVNEKGFQNRNAEIGKISRTLKQIAKEMNLDLFGLSQLSREVEKRGDKRPIMSDLRDSGEIEQDADAIIFNYRPEYYGILEDENGQSTMGLLELIMAKNRNGSLGIAQQFCELQYQRIGNFE